MDELTTIKTSLVVILLLVYLLIILHKNEKKNRLRRINRKYHDYIESAWNEVNN